MVVAGVAYVDRNAADSFGSFADAVASLSRTACFLASSLSFC